MHQRSHGFVGGEGHRGAAKTVIGPRHSVDMANQSTDNSDSAPAERASEPTGSLWLCWDGGGSRSADESMYREESSALMLMASYRIEAVFGEVRWVERNVA